MTDLEKQLKDLIEKSYDFYANMIDDGRSYKRAIENNKEVINILNYFGYDLELNKIEPKKVIQYKSSGYTSTDKESIINRSIEIYNRLRDSTTYLAGEENRKKYATEASFYEEIVLTPIKCEYGFKLQEVSTKFEIEGLLPYVER